MKVTKAEKSVYDKKRYKEKHKDILARVLVYGKTDRGREVNRRASLKYGSKYGAYRSKRFYARMKQNDEAYQELLRRRRANNKVAYALKVGKLEKGLCETCGSPDTEAHHDDYNKPLDVTWLCPLHHGETRRSA